MHVHAAAPIMSSIYLMHFHFAKLRSHPLRVLCTCILSARTIRRPRPRKKSPSAIERDRAREKESLRRIEIGFAKSFPVTLQSASFTINGVCDGGRIAANIG